MGKERSALLPPKGDVQMCGYADDRKPEFCKKNASIYHAGSQARDEKSGRLAKSQRLRKSDGVRMCRCADDEAGIL
jgi:hypothetical protein